MSDQLETFIFQGFVYGQDPSDGDIYCIRVATERDLLELPTRDESTFFTGEQHPNDDYMRRALIAAEARNRAEYLPTPTTVAGPWVDPWSEQPARQRQHQRHHLSDAGPGAYRVAPKRYERGFPEDQGTTMSPEQIQSTWDRHKGWRIEACLCPSGRTYLGCPRHGNGRVDVREDSQTHSSHTDHSWVRFDYRGMTGIGRRRTMDGDGNSVDDTEEWDPRKVAYVGIVISVVGLAISLVAIGLAWYALP
jgi:hypothetical protein